MSKSLPASVGTREEWRRAAGTLRDRLDAGSVIARRTGHGANAMLKLLAGKDLAPAEVARARVAVCRSCDLFTGRTCGKFYKTSGKGCGCLVYRKTKLASERCPLGKW